MPEKKSDTPSPKNFKLMVFGQIISILGSALLRFALSLYVLDTTGSEALFATMFAISNIPLLLAPLGQILYGVIFEAWGAQIFIPTFFVGIVTLLLGGLTQRMFQCEEER